MMRTNFTALERIPALIIVIVIDTMFDNVFYLEPPALNVGRFGDSSIDVFLESQNKKQCTL